MQGDYVSGSDESVAAFFKGIVESWGSCVAKVTADYLESLSPECEKQVRQAIAYLRAKEDKEDSEYNESYELGKGYPGWSGIFRAVFAFRAAARANG